MPAACCLPPWLPNSPSPDAAVLSEITVSATRSAEVAPRRQRRQAGGRPPGAGRAEQQRVAELIARSCPALRFLPIWITPAGAAQPRC
ncbi:MAG: hypothetical protein U1E47_05990 [Rivihabitans pingtungensis]